MSLITRDYSTLYKGHLVSEVITTCIVMAETYDIVREAPGLSADNDLSADNENIALR